MAVKIWGAGLGAGLDGQWDTILNWSGNTAPVNGDSILFDGTSTNALTTGPASDVTIANYTINASESLNTYFSNNGGTVYITGDMVNNAALGYSLGLVGFEGVTSVVGQWVALAVNSRTLISGSDYELSLNINNVVFNNSNYIAIVEGYVNLVMSKPSQVPFNSFTIQNDGSNNHYTWSFNYDKLKITATTFNLNNGLLQVSGNSAFSVPTSSSPWSGKNIACDTFNANFTNPSMGMFSDIIYSGGNPSSNDSIHFLISALTTNLTVNLYSNSIIEQNSYYSGVSVVARNIWTGFSAVSGNLQVNISGSFFLGLNQGDVFKGSSGEIYNLCKMEWTTGQINVRQLASVSMLQMRTFSGSPFNYPSIKFYDNSTLIGGGVNSSFGSSTLEFFDNSRVAPELILIEVVTPMFGPSFSVFTANYPSAGTTDLTNKNSRKSSF